MSSKFVQTFLAEENISETMKTVAERVSATGATLTSAASALFDFGEEASNATKKVTPLQSTLANIDKSAGTVSVGVQSMNKELKSISGASDDAAKSLRKISTEGIAVRSNLIDNVASATAAIRNSFRIMEVAAKALAKPLQEFSRFEDAATRLAPLVGGLESAKILCAQLRDEAANGTMSFEQLTSVAGRLASVFKSSSDIKKWTTAFHDLSAGTGLDINELIGNFTKLKAAGRVTFGANRGGGNAILFQTREAPDCGGNLLRFDAPHTRSVPARFSGIREYAF